MRALITKVLLPCVLAASFNVCAFGYSGVMNYITDSGLVTGEPLGFDEENRDLPDENPAEQSETAIPILTNHYNSVRGSISDIVYDEKNIIISLSGAGNVHYNISPDVLIYSLNAMEPISAGRLSKGREVSVFYNVYTPVSQQPAGLTPEVLVLHDNEQAAMVKVDYFDESGLSSDKTLRLNRNEEMLVVAKDSKTRMFDDLRDKNLLVFYDISTLSPSAQAPPIKVVILGSEVLKQRSSDIGEQNEEEILQEELTEEPVEGIRDILSRNLEGYAINRGEVRYVPLYKAAETLGYDLQWDEAARLVTIYMPDGKSYTFVNGSQEYGYNGERAYFTNAPFISDSRTYVDEAFIEKIIME